MTRGKGDNVIASAIEEWTSANQERIDALKHEGLENGIDVALRASAFDGNL